MSELKQLSVSLKGGKDEINAMESQRSLLQQELNEARLALTDIISESERQHDNVAAVRERLIELQNEEAAWRTRTESMKEIAEKSEQRARTTKETALFSLHSLQLEVVSIQSEIARHKEAAAAALARRKEEEAELEKVLRSHREKSKVASRELEETRRMASEFGEAVKAHQSEVRELEQKKAVLLEEIESATRESSSAAHSRQSEIFASERRLEELRRQQQDCECRVSASKDALSSTEAEIQALRHTADELNRQQAELRKSLEAKRKAAEKESAHLQQQILKLNSTMRQSTVEADQRRSDAETLASEVRRLEQRVEELRRTIKDGEGQISQQQEMYKVLENDLLKARTTLTQATNEEGEARLRLKHCRSQLEIETRTAESIQKRVLGLQEEELRLKEGEARAKSSLTSLRTEIEDNQVMK